MQTLLTIVLAVAFFAACTLAGGCIFGGVIWAAWNFGVATIATVPHLGFWPAVLIGWALSALAGLVRR